jgi:hypothetical protein
LVVVVCPQQGFAKGTEALASLPNVRVDVRGCPKAPKQWNAPRARRSSGFSNDHIHASDTSRGIRAQRRARRGDKWGGPLLAKLARPYLPNAFGLQVKISRGSKICKALVSCICRAAQSCSRNDQNCAVHDGSAAENSSHAARRSASNASDLCVLTHLRTAIDLRFDDSKN